MSAPWKELPPIWKDRTKYDIDDAIWLWIHALGQDVPLNPEYKERGRYRREYKAAKEELMTNVTPKKRIRRFEMEGDRKVRELFRYDPDDRPWVTQEEPHDYFDGRELAVYAARCGFPGLFGFEEPKVSSSGKYPEVSSREEPSVLAILAVFVVEKYGPDAIKEMRQQRAKLTGTAIRLIENHGLNMDPDTVRKYLKNLPDLPK